MTAASTNRSAPSVIRLRPPDRAVIESFRAFVTGLPEVLSVFVMSGSDDFLLHIAVADNDHLSGFLDRLTQRREIVDVRTSVIFDHFRRTVVTPPGGEG
ncbi:Lrp/AsnC ligand binding domain-containing protein [Amycolatopsis sp. lyj-346]|uniref:Lrp/AsnC ligand binding domain-containing protein n=1 Tax=Amycolatopsis sp. lyj-346 TaxID=2789289 RepID=UPI00397D4DC9